MEIAQIYAKFLQVTRRSGSGFRGRGKCGRSRNMGFSAFLISIIETDVRADRSVAHYGPSFFWVRGCAGRRFSPLCPCWSCCACRRAPTLRTNAALTCCGRNGIDYVKRITHDPFRSAFVCASVGLQEHVLDQRQSRESNMGANWHTKQYVVTRQALLDHPHFVCVCLSPRTCERARDEETAGRRLC